jgi:hypothetical protein
MVLLAMRSIVQNATFSYWRRSLTALQGQGLLGRAWLLTMRVSGFSENSDLIPRRRAHPSRPSVGEAAANGARQISAVSRDGSE